MSVTNRTSNRVTGIVGGTAIFLATKDEEDPDACDCGPTGTAYSLVDDIYEAAGVEDPGVETGFGRIRSHDNMAELEALAIASAVMLLEVLDPDKLS